jgi:hypothetical protein
MEKMPEKIDKRFQHNFIIKSLKLILYNNVFYFDGKYYIQKKGAAMGTIIAPTYATLVLGYLEETLYERMKTKYNNEFSIYLRLNWKRFLDDCFLILPKEIDTSDFLNELNNLHQSIQFTYNESESAMAFLDILVLKSGNNICTDLYCKPTDTHNYLDFRSCHPKHTKVNIPFNLASRIITIVKNKDLQEKRLTELKLQLKQQNYPDVLIQHGIEQAISKGPIKTTDRKDTRTSAHDVIPFVSTHNPRNTNMFPVINSCKIILQKSERMKNILQKKRIINSKRQPKNLKQILSPSRFDMKVDIPSVTKCNRSRCKTCPSIIEGNTIQFINGKNFTVKQSMTCITKNVIYSIICPNCQQFYIGQTKNGLNLRMNLHRQQTNTESLRFLKVNKHLHECSGGKFNIFPLYKVLKIDDHFRDEKELFLISILKPQLNSSY